MRMLTAKEAKYGFGRAIDLARAGPLIIAKHGRPIVLVMAFEKFDWLNVVEVSRALPGRLKI